jgi:hypothetical protein
VQLGNLATAMAPLRDLPVWVVVRLCTDDQKYIDYWSNLDRELELNMEVLDGMYQIYTKCSSNMTITSVIHTSIKHRRDYDDFIFSFVMQHLCQRNSNLNPNN